MKKLSLATILVLGTFIIGIRGIYNDPSNPMPLINRLLPSLIFIGGTLTAIILSIKRHKNYIQALIIKVDDQDKAEQEETDTRHSEAKSEANTLKYTGQQEGDEIGENKYKELENSQLEADKHVIVAKNLRAMFNDAFSADEIFIEESLIQSYKEGEESNESLNGRTQYHTNGGKVLSSIVIAIVCLGSIATSSVRAETSILNTSTVETVLTDSIASSSPALAGDECYDYIIFLYDKSGSVHLPSKGPSIQATRKYVEKDFLEISEDYRRCGFILGVALVNSSRITLIEKFEIEYGQHQLFAKRSYRNKAIQDTLDVFQNYIQSVVYDSSWSSTTSLYPNIVNVVENLNETPNVRKRELVIVSDMIDSNMNWNEYLKSPKYFRDHYEEMAQAFKDRDEIDMRNISAKIIYDYQLDSSYLIAEFFEFYFEEASGSFDTDVLSQF